MDQVFPTQSSPPSGAESSGHGHDSSNGNGNGTHALLHHNQHFQEPRHFHVVQQSIQEHLLRQQQQQQQQTPSVFFPNFPPNPFNKHEVGGIVERSSHSLDNSLSSGPLLSSTTKSFSAVSMEGSIQNEKAEQSSLPPLAPRVPGPKKKCSGKVDANGGTCASLGRCHCSKRRYLT